MAATAGADRPEEHEVVLHEERPVVDTEAVPVERVRLGTETHTDHETVGGEVRREKIEVDTDAGTVRERLPALHGPRSPARDGARQRVPAQQSDSSRAIRRGGPQRTPGARPPGRRWGGEWAEPKNMPGRVLQPFSAIGLHPDDPSSLSAGLIGVLPRLRRVVGERPGRTIDRAVRVR
jgi:hypothetical protein